MNILCTYRCCYNGTIYCIYLCKLYQKIACIQKRVNILALAEGEVLANTYSLLLGAYLRYF